MAELSPGATLARYRIIDKIGAGGMGEVYRAQDTELGRPVALKFLTTDVSQQPSRLKRFIQEAKAASALNHPNILTVYEIGRVDDHTFIATEFVEGVTLRQHMRYQRLKLLEVLDIAIQISSALVAAHAAGIVHRDIKPENIMVRKDGIVKLLDFGLAKLTERGESISGLEATTMALVNTEPGSVLGTATYMSPEQAAGREVDARSDIWSLGVVLYEMVAAHPPFEGASKSHIIVAIIDHDPIPITQFAPEVPEALEWIIAEALTKAADERCQTAKEMLSKLKRLKQRAESGTLPTSPSEFNRSIRSSTETVRPAGVATLNETLRSTAGNLNSTQAISSGLTTQTRSRQLIYMAALVLGLIVVAAGGFGLYKLFTRPKEFGPARMTALTTGGKINGEDINGQVSISPDGKYVVSAANDAKQQASLWLRQISTNSLVRIVPPEIGGYLATTFSPDGEHVYYVATLEKNKFVPTLYRVPVLGGSPAKVLDRVFSAIGFSPDGKQFAFVRKNQDDMALMIANADGNGEPRSIAVLKQPNGFSTSGPSWSPDAKRIATGMFNASGAGYSTVAEVPVQGGEPQPIGSEKWASVGRLLWLGDGSGLVMTAQPEVSSIGTQVWLLPYRGGPARRITNDLNGYGEVSLGLTADSGTIATIQQVNASSIWISTPNEDESRARQVLKTNLPESVAWTPDGKIVYASRTGENWDIWIANSDGSASKQLTNDPFIDHQPTVSPDNRYVVFQSTRTGARNIWRVDADGSNAKQLTEGNYVDANPVVSPDGRFVIFMSLRSGTWTIWKVGIDGGAPVQLTNRSSEFPSISPDGKSISYFYVDEQATNQPRMGIIAFDGGAPVKTIDLPRSVQPIAFSWMPDGQSIAFLDNSSGILNVWSQPLDGGTPKQLTNFKSEFVTSFAISRDGKIATYRWSATRDIVLIKDFK
ncbi:MAG TPA: protein kinase [Pyrinomonadaceae bacterium]|nr:protein kinase [Pyrinomonadaceae bacterium]